jgi:phage terminase large subunit-like protein
MFWLTLDSIIEVDHSAGCLIFSPASQPQFTHSQLRCWLNGLVAENFTDEIPVVIGLESPAETG